MSYPAAPTYWVEPTGDVEHLLRRYASGSACPIDAHGYHNATIPTGIVDARHGERAGRRVLESLPATPADDERWPTTCDCGYEFTEDDPRQDFQMEIYQRVDGSRCVLGQGRAVTCSTPSAEPGAMWDAWWLGDWNRGADGIALAVLLPNGRTWLVDSRASNCTLPDDDIHQCWVRHGDPRTEPVHVDKDGVTCSAGAGSIQADDYHGFLHHGLLTAG